MDLLGSRVESHYMCPW